MSRIIGADTFHEVWSTISRNPRRSLLTAFGVFWGMFMLVIMLSMGRGLTNGILDQISFIPKNVTICWTDVTSIPWQGFRKGRSWNFKNSDVIALKKEIPELETIAPQVSPYENVNVVNREKTGSYRIKGVDGNFHRLFPIKVVQGRYINDIDVAQCRKVCVLGQKIIDEIYHGKSQVGKYVMVGGISYQCVGIVQRSSENMNIEGPDDQVVTMPYTLVQKLYNLGEIIGILMIQARADMPIATFENRVREIMCTRHQICPEDRKAMSFINLDQQIMVFQSLCIGISALLWIVGLGTLLSGAIGVSNIVMITVKERTREIGVRRAIGARPGSIIAQIMSESLMLTASAGMIGFICGVALMSTISQQEIKLGDSGLCLINPLIDFGAGMAALAVIVIIGLAAGILPASRALKIKAIDAIREE